MSETVPAPSSAPSRHSALAWIGAFGLAILLGVSLWFYPPLRDASQSLERPDWVKFLGRFHVVALHLPVGVLVLAALMELLVLLRHKTATILAPAITFTLTVGAWGAVIAVIFGGFLSRRGGFENAEFYAHQALGIATAVGVILTLMLKLVVDGSARLLWVYRALFAITFVVMGVGAHFGGNMVHESDYLTKYASEPIRNLIEGTEEKILAWFEPVKPSPGQAPAMPGKTPAVPGKSGTQMVSIKPAKSPTVYAALVAPILDAKCGSCHNEEKSKGDLRLDTHEFLMKGGTNGVVVVPGEPEKSRLIACMTLPADDDDHMPPLKKPQPTSEEIALLTWWIYEGASKDLKMSTVKPPNEFKTLIKTLMSGAKGGSAGGTPPVILSLAEAAAQVDSAAAEAMKKINGSGASLAPIAADAKELRFTALNVAKDFTDAGLKDLEPVMDKIVALDLAKTKVTDAACASIAKMKNLRELHLENTVLTDAGAAQFKTLAALEYLNLYGTKITDNTLKELAPLGKLKSLYLWQTGVTKPGAAAFKASHPNAVVNAGWTEADNAKVVATADVKPAAAPAPPAKEVKKVVASVAVVSATATVAVGVKPDQKPADAKPADAKSADAKSAETKPANAAGAANPNAIIYKDVIAPILASKCTACHGTEKSKGKLRMHTFADLMKGGSDGATTVIAGKPDDSLMLKRTSLPVDDDDHMPPKDEKQATKEEIAILKWWIENGASETLTVAAAKKTPEIEGFLKMVLTSTKGGASSATAKADKKPKAKPLTAEEKKAVAEVTAKMTALNASLMPLALDTEQLRFGCINAADKFGDTELGDLAPAAPHIVWADFARSKVTDAGLATLSKMTNLERLHLENTAVTDAGLAHLTKLGHLQYLNLYGTKVTDAGIAGLASNKELKKLFVWQTGVTAAAAKQLEAAVPGLVVNIGLSESEIAKLVEENKPPQPAGPAKPAEAKKPEPKAPAKPATEPAKPEAKPAAKPGESDKPAAPAQPKKK